LSIEHLEVFREAYTFSDGDIKDSVTIAGNTADTKTLVIDFIPSALRADSFNWVETGSAAAFAVGEDLVESTARNAEISLSSVSIGADTLFSLNVVGGVSRASCADTIDPVSSLSAVTSL